MVKAGWLKRQVEKVQEDVKKWPAWMRREAGLEPTRETMAKDAPSPQRQGRDPRKTKG